MKKIISLLLSAIMIFSVALPASAAYPIWQDSVIPIVRICGDGQALVDGSGNQILNFKKLLLENGDDGESTLLESVVNVVIPFLVDGLLTDNWEPYYEALEKEIAELFENSHLDKSGNPEPGSGVRPELKEKNAQDLVTNRINEYGKYWHWDYELYYDWRLDPWDNADALNEYIKDIKKVTGFEKVGLLSSCVGTHVALAYIQKYGTVDVSFVGLDISVSGGSELLSEPISGKFNLDGNAINRFLIDCNAVGLFSIDAFLNQTIDLIVATGLIDKIGEGVKKTLYEKLVHGVTSALALSTLYNYPSYWAAVKAEDLEEAKNYVFGPEGSEKRKEYAGLIARIDNYDREVRQQIPALLAEIDRDANIGIVAKYGMQIGPICQSNDVVGDQIASLTCASFGATTSTIHDTLSDDYIAQRVAEGKGKYISPDKQVDASTCLYPDYTWFIKGVRHSEYIPVETGILTMICSENKQLTIDDFEVGQFMVHDFETGVSSKMTEENCNTYNWDTTDPNKGSDGEKRMNAIMKLIKWIIEVFKKLFNITK